MIIYDQGTDGIATSRRMRQIAMLTAVIAIAPLCVIGVVATADSWWEGLIVAVGLLLFLSVLKDWSLDGYPRRVVIIFIFTGATWLCGALTLAGPLGFVPFSLVGALLVARLPNQRLLLTVAFALGVGLIGATVLAPRRPSSDLIDWYVLLPVAGTLFIAGVVSVSERSWLVVRRLERAKEAEADLALAHERMRFAGDLHDIQGHTLHVIKLKTALAQRLVDSNPERAQKELGEIRGLVDDTIRKTRALAYAQHEIDFSTELENARRLCEAVGINVQVQHDDGAVIAIHPLLSHVLREAATNLLRHASPTHVSITVSRGRIEVENDGVAEGGKSGLGGLARLQERIELAGGQLGTARSPGRFTVWATLEAEDGNNASLLSTETERDHND